MVHIRYSTNFNQSDDTASRNACGSCFLWPSHLFHEFHLEFYYYTKELRTGQRSGTKNVIVRMGERGRKKRKSKIKIQDGFQVLVIVLNETTLYFIWKKGSLLRSPPNSFVPLRRANRKLNWKFFYLLDSRKGFLKIVSEFYCTVYIIFKYIYAIKI